jgi:hypothetical protein
MLKDQSTPICDSTVVAISQFIDDAQGNRRDPSHSDLELEIRQAGLVDGDPRSQGLTVAKAKRI